MVCFDDLLVASNKVAAFFKPKRSAFIVRNRARTSNMFLLCAGSRFKKSETISFVPDNWLKSKTTDVLLDKVMLSEQIANDMKAAMKAKDEATLSTLRFLRSALKNKQIDVQHELSDEEIQQVIRTQVKQLKDARESFVKGDRSDLAEKAEKERMILERYLPRELTDEELAALVRRAKTEMNATSQEDRGKLMGRVMKEAAGRANGSRVKAFVEKILLGSWIFFALTLQMPRVAHAAFDSDFSSFAFTDSWLTFGLRLTRVLLLWIGIFAINTILHGAIEYATASNRDEAHKGAWNKMINGFATTFIIICLFSVASISLKVL